MERKIAKGDPVLWYGHSLACIGVETKDGVTVAELIDQGGVERRDAIKAEFTELREKQAGMGKDQDREHAEIAARIRELDQQHRSAIVHVKLRVDLLSYWEQKAVWVSDGRILTDEQQAKFKEITGAKVKPEGQRAALLMLESVEG